MTDLEIQLNVPNEGSCRVLFEEISPTRIFVHHIFVMSDDVEVDFAGLPVDVKDFILAECREECEKRKKQQTQ